MTNKLVLDLETKKTFDEVGGYQNTHLLGITVVGVYDYATDSFKAYREGELDKLGRALKEADLIIGFNSKKFDFTVLQPYLPHLSLDQLPHLDILEEVHKALGFRLKLDSLAQTTLLEGKSGNGLDAIRYYRQGDWANLEKYCLDDVRITRDLYEYGRAHGKLWYSQAGQLTPIAARWGEPPTVAELLATAFAKGLQAEVDYLDQSLPAPNRGKPAWRRIEVRGIDGQTVRTFSHQDNAERAFLLPRIRRARLLGQTGSVQGKLGLIVKTGA